MSRAQIQEIKTNDIVKVLVVDDSALIRQLLGNVLSASPNIEVVDSAVDARDAREKIKRYNPDVITLDIEMPGMDGISFLEKIMKLRPMPVVMCSTLTKQGAKETLRALSIGAVDFISKPEINVEEDLNRYADEIISKVLVASKVKFKTGASASSSRNTVLPVPKRVARNKLVAIGSSTGGTQALEVILQRLPKESPPIVISQHIPNGFSAAFCERVNDLIQIELVEATDGAKIFPGRAYMAPGGKHLAIRNMRGSLSCELLDTEPVNRHKPSVDVMFDSIVDAGIASVAFLLTGMGKDGAKGMLNMYEKGIHTIAQDEKSSLVWGMPKRAIELGAAKHIASLDEIAGLILDMAY